MKIKRIEVFNFRILKSAIVDLDDDITMIVGRNNSGKTSLTEIFQAFFSGEKIKFKFDDFSLSTHREFDSAYAAYMDYEASVKNNESEEVLFEKEDAFKKALPAISANIYVEYLETDNLASISEFIMDLDVDRKDIMISCQYGITEARKFFIGFTQKAQDYDNKITDYLKNNIQFLERKFFVVDSKDQTIRHRIEKYSDIEKLFLPRFIKAQTILDDQSEDSSKKLSKTFEHFYKYSHAANQGAVDLEGHLTNTASKLDENYKMFFQPFFSNLEQFGLNTGINKKELELELRSHFEVAKVLKNNANLFYRHDDQLLPEAYNGLGYSRLIFILLSILNYFEEQNHLSVPPNISLLFIEEPEAHLHPQMQQTFIKNLKDFIRLKNWNVQIIITTHSSHIVADSGFESIRYFQKIEKQINVKNLSEFSKSPSANLSIEFLRQYMTIYNCDMFFADKIIMIEGTVERLLLPALIKKAAPDLTKQYITIIEIGGAYAHKFREILAFLGVKTLIITDIDSINKSDNRKSCKVSIEDHIVTSNQTLASWLPKEDSIQNLLGMPEERKIEGTCRVAYQIPEAEGNKTGRSFEEAFILKNAIEFHTNTSAISTKHLFQAADKTTPLAEAEIIENSYEIAGKIPKKTDFAFDIVQLKTWTVPRYIAEGLLWLQE